MSMYPHDEWDASMIQAMSRTAVAEAPTPPVLAPRQPKPVVVPGRDVVDKKVSRQRTREQRLLLALARLLAARIR